MAQLSEVVAEAGITDVAEGANLIAASEDIAALSAVVGLMGAEDLDNGLEVARTAGELLQNVAVEIILRAAGTRALSQVLIAESEAVADLGAGKVAEGIVRMLPQRPWPKEARNWQPRA